MIYIKKEGLSDELSQKYVGVKLYYFGKKYDALVRRGI